MTIILMTLWTNDIYLTLFDISIFIVTFVCSYNISYYFGKYLRTREERTNFELFFKSIKKCSQQNTQ